MKIENVLFYYHFFIYYFIDTKQTELCFDFCNVILQTPCLSTCIDNLASPAHFHCVEECNKGGIFSDTSVRQTEKQHQFFRLTEVLKFISESIEFITFIIQFVIFLPFLNRSQSLVPENNLLLKIYIILQKCLQFIIF